MKSTLPCHPCVVILLLAMVGVNCLPSWQPPAPSEWRKQAIYQILTDRFATSDNGTKRCTNFQKYCGGTFKGIVNRIPYIKQMGFTAVWISPVQSQTKGLTWDYPDGYHGFWPKDLYEINEYFGGRDEMNDMLDKLHEAGLMVMLDIVPNHMGYVQPADNFSALVPFNESTHYHSCDDCGMFCMYIGTSDFSRERCRLSNLPDLAHEVPYVRDQLVTWLKWMQANFQFDAFRVDAASHMGKAFNQVLKNASSVFTIGEYYMSKPYDQVAEWLGDRLNSGALHSSLGITMMIAMREVFMQRSAPMSLLPYVRKQWLNYFPDHMPYIGMFIDSHDEDRFLCSQQDVPLYKNALAFIYYVEGMPIVYYGMEQGMGGNRDPLWHAGYSEDAELYVYIKMLNWYRNSNSLWDFNVSDVHADGDYYVFARGPFLVALSARGSGASRAKYTLDNIPKRFAGATLSNVLDPLDMLVVTDSGNASWTTGANGNPQIFMLGTPRPPAEFGSYTPKTWPASTDLTVVITSVVVAAAMGLAMALLLHWASFISGDTRRKWHKTLHGWGQRIYFWSSGPRRGMRMSLSGKHMRPSKEVALVYDPEAGVDDGDSFQPGMGELKAGPLATAGKLTSSGRKARASLDQGGLGTESLLSHGTVGSASLRKSSSLRKSKVVQAASLQVASPPTVPLAVMTSGDMEGGSMREYHRAGHLMTLATRRELTGALVSLEVDHGRVSLSNFPTGNGEHSPSGRYITRSSWQYSRPTSPSNSMRSRITSPRLISTVSMPHDRAAKGVSSSATTPFARPGATTAAHVLAAMADDHGLQASTKPQHRLQPSLSDRDIDYNTLLMSDHEAQHLLQQQNQQRRQMYRQQPQQAQLQAQHPQQLAGAAGRYAPDIDTTSEATISIPPTPSAFYPPTEPDTDQAAEDAVPELPARPTTSNTYHTHKSVGFASSSEHSQQGPYQPQDSQHMNGSVAGTEAAPFQVSPECTLHVAMEYSIPHLGFNDQFVYGGLGKVVDVFLRCWEGDLALCAPLYRAAYEDDDATRPSFCGEAIATFTVTVGYKLHQVDIFRLQAGRVTYFLLQADIFRMREKATIYTFSNEANMLTWLSVFSQAVSVVVRQYGVQQVQYHDYHGALSLLYLPPDEPIKVVYVAHNAHYNGVFLLPSKERRSYLYSMFDLNPELCQKATEHKTAFDILHAVVHYIRLHQRGFGVVGVSPRYAQEILAKQSVFWRLDGNQLQGITNALIESPNNLAVKGLPLDEVLALKARAKLALQRQLGMDVGEDNQLLVFMGRMTHQKGCDIIAEASKHFMEDNPKVQLICVGPIGDLSGAKAQAELEAVAERFPGRMWCPRNRYVTGELRELLWHASDWCLCPSRFEPCGLVDIEFGWNGALIIGHNTGGLGKMPGMYFKVESSRLAHLAAKLQQEVKRALELGQEQRRAMVQDALVLKFPTTAMVDKYRKVWATVSAAVDEDAQDQAREETKKLQQFYDDKWRKHNIQGPDATDQEAPPDDGLPLLTILGARVPLPAHQDVSNVLLLALQSGTMLPSLLLLSFVIWSEFFVVSISQCRAGIDDSSSVFSGVLSGLTLRAVMFFASGTVLGPLWSLLVFRLRPLTYIRMVVVLLVVQLLVALVCLLESKVINVGLILTSACALSGNPLMALGYLGKETTTEVAEVGMTLMGATEFMRALVLMITALLPAVATSKTTFLATAGCMLVLSALLAVWFFWEPALPSEYRHIKLLAKGTAKMLRGVWSFYLTIIICALDLFAVSLIGFLTLLEWQLHAFTMLYAVLYGVAAASVLLLVWLLSMRWAQLHIHKWLLAIAALPGYSVLMALVVWKIPEPSVRMGVGAVVQLLLGERQHVVGLLGFQALPSREAVAVWQLLVVTCSCVMAFLVAIAGSQVGLMVLVPDARGITMVLGLVEVVRFVCAALLAKRHGQEDLTSL